MLTRINEINSSLKPYINDTSNETYHRILEYSKKLFISKGFAKETINDICETLKISRKTFYTYFPNKKVLVYTIIAQNDSYYLDQLKEIFTSSLPSSEKLYDLILLILDFVPKNYSPAFLNDLQLILPDLWDKMISIQEISIQIICEIITSGQNQGVFQKSIDANKNSKILILLVNKLFDPWLMKENGLEVDDILPVIFGYIRCELLAPYVS